MASERNSHQLKYLNQLNSIVKVMQDSPLKDNSLNRAGLQLKKLIASPWFAQVIDVTQEQNQQSNLKLKRLEKTIMKTFNGLESMIMLELKDNQSSLKPSLIGSVEESMEDIASFPEAKESPIYEKFYRIRRLSALNLQAKKIKNDSIIWLFSLPNIEADLDEIYRFSEFILWEKERNKARERARILRLVNYFNQFDWGNAQDYTYEEFETLGLIIQEICDFFIEKLTIATELSTSKIKTITYKYTQAIAPKKSQLEIYINDKKIVFTADSSEMLKIMLDNPFEDIEVEELITQKNTPKQDPNNPHASRNQLDSDISLANKKAYDRIYRKFEAVNQRMALNDQTIEFGILSFIIIEKYSFFVNPCYARFIKAH